jgi:hypothetical protein
MMTEVATVSIVAKNKYSKKSRRPAPSGQRRNEGQETVYKGYNATRDYIRQPVRSKRKQSTRQNHGDGYFHQDR